jgi:hypothetical protein
MDANKRHGNKDCSVLKRALSLPDPGQILSEVSHAPACLLSMRALKTVSASHCSCDADTVLTPKGCRNGS